MTYGGCDKSFEVVEPMRPKNDDGCLLRLDEIGGVKDSLNRSGGNDVLLAKVSDPTGGVHGHFLVDPFTAIDFGVGPLALQREHTTIIESCYDVAVVVSDFTVHHEFARVRRVAAQQGLDALPRSSHAAKREAFEKHLDRSLDGIALIGSPRRLVR